MLLSWLVLSDYRCYEAVRFSPAPGVNVLVGANGAGKTSLLEAIGYLGLLRSFRRTPDEALVRTGVSQMVARGEFTRPHGEVLVEVEVPIAGRRRVLMNGKRPKRNRDVLTEVPVVAFLPDDLDLVKRGPALRREYLDELAAQLRPQAAADQAEYERTVRQRNSLLRQEGVDTDPATLEVWDERLADAGARVFRQRAQVIGELDPFLDPGYRAVGGAGALRWEYGSNWGAGSDLDDESLVTALRRALGERRSRDLTQRTTTAGPHRDDPGLTLDARPLRTHASQGEQRTAALAMRVGAYRLLADHRSSPPLLLLDDVFSELDANRVRGVVDMLPVGQVFVTTAREDDVPVAGTRWLVSEGGVK
jgi:DNA replication and repair protein RecF